MFKQLRIMLAAGLCFGLFGCAAGQNEEVGDRETINQVALLQSLTLGDYYGSVPVKDLKKMGDMGIGTFDGLNGELIMLEGNVYRALSDGSVEVVKDEETIPFADVTWFDSDASQDISDIKDIQALKDLLDKEVKERGANRFYMIRIDGTFPTMNARSEYAQSEPYKPLAKVLETDQVFFNYENILGTVVALYCPDYMGDLNTPGWHFHFISNDRAKGGHVLDLSIEQAKLSWDDTSGFSMKLPEEEMFRSLDLTVDQSDDIRKVEQGE